MQIIKAVPLAEIYKVIADIHNDYVGTDKDDYLWPIHEIERRLEEKVINLAKPEEET